MNSKTNLITKVKIFNCEEIQCTDNHPFYAKTEDIDTPFWVNAEDLTDKHYVAMPKNVAIKQYTFNSWKDGVEHIWIKVENVEFIHKTETVYNLSVEEDTSYTANNIAVHNCAFLVTNDPITRSFGLMRVKDEIVCMVEGNVADSWKYVKNDLLSVSVWSIIGNIFKRINKPIMMVNELLETVKDDKKVWDIYEKGYTVCINQVEQPASKQAVIKYKPTNISELTAFTSAVRPGFKSMFSKFLSRDTFDYGIKLVDDLIQTPEMPYSYILYQEAVMKLLVFAGFEESETMLIIKAISKKVKEKIMKAQNRFIIGLSKRLEDTGESKESSKDKAEKMWQIIEDSSRYSSLGRLI